MDTQTGKIVDLTDDEIDHFRHSEPSNRRFNAADKMVELIGNEKELLKPLPRKVRKGYMRNQPCICGSGKKFKKCCWSKFR